MSPNINWQVVPVHLEEWDYPACVSVITPMGMRLLHKQVRCPHELATAIVLPPGCNTAMYSVTTALGERIEGIA